MTMPLTKLEKEAIDTVLHGIAIMGATCGVVLIGYLLVKALFLGT